MKTVEYLGMELEVHDSINYIRADDLGIIWGYKYDPNVVYDKIKSTDIREIVGHFHTLPTIKV